MNNARSIIIILVVLLHVALAFSDSAKEWWIIVHQGSSVIADIIAGSLDVFLMPTLFFISGFFAIASYRRHGALGLIKKKVRALALPWAIGVVLLNPFSVLMLNNARGIAGNTYLAGDRVPA